MQPDIVCRTRAEPRRAPVRRLVMAMVAALAAIAVCGVYRRKRPSRDGPRCQHACSE